MTELPGLPPAISSGPDGPALPGRSYTAGFSDAIGDRKLTFDVAASTSFEVLHFKKEFSDAPAFEAALRARVAVVRQAAHPSLAVIHAVERLDGEGLSLVSRHTTGRRVSELVPKARGAAFALELIRQVTPALASLQRMGEGVAHGALSADRIVVTREGRLVVIEHVLGSAIEALALSRPRLHELGLVVPAGADPVRFTARTDIAQLGFVALSLLLGRPLHAADYPEQIIPLLDEFAQTSGSPVLAAKLRMWLERAMQISPRSFQSARAALDAFGDLPDDVDVKVAEAAGGLLDLPSEQVAPASVPAAVPPAPAPIKVADRQAPAVVAHAVVPAAIVPPVMIPPAMIPPASAPARRSGRVPGIVTAALAVVAVAEGVVIAFLLSGQPATAATEPPPSAVAAAPVAPVAPATAHPDLMTNSVAGLGSASVQPTAPEVVPPPATTAAPLVAASGVPPAPADAVPPAAAGTRVGGITVSSPIDLQVWKDGKLIGSTAGPIAINDGSHSVEFVNEALGFRFRQTVVVKPGQMAAIKIGVPNGRVSINAVPWAEVTIDGNPAGETPLANLSLPIGPHEIVFRHPELGEKKQTVIVKVDGLTKVTQTLGQDAQTISRGAR